MEFVVIGRLPMFDLFPENLLPLPWDPSTNNDFFFIHVKLSFKGQKQNLQNIPCRFRIWIGFVGQTLIKLTTFFIQLLDYLLGVTLCKHEWPLKRPPHLYWSMWYGGLKTHWLELSALYQSGCIRSHDSIWCLYALRQTKVIHGLIM